MNFNRLLLSCRHQVQKLIIDLRGNTGGYVDAAIAMAKQIVPEGVIISTKDKQGKETVYKSDLKVRPLKSMLFW